MRVDYEKIGAVVVVKGKGFTYSQLGQFRTLEVTDPKISMQATMNIIDRKLKEEEQHD